MAFFEKRLSTCWASFLDLDSGLSEQLTMSVFIGSIKFSVNVEEMS